jgi:hypothetical protein
MGMYKSVCKLCDKPFMWHSSTGFSDICYDCRKINLQIRNDSSTELNQKNKMIELNKQLAIQFEKMCATGKLFRSEITGQQIWDLYISSFPKEQNPIFRDPNSSQHNCNLCNNFLRRYGNIVAIDENLKIMTIFDIEVDEEYSATIQTLSTKLKKAKIAEIFLETFQELNSLPYESCTKTNTVFQLGTAKNHKRYTKEEAEKFGVVKPDEIRSFHHMHLFLPKMFVDITGNSVESIMAGYRDAKNVFQRAMEEISLDTLKLVRDLINQGSLLNGEAHLKKIEEIIPLKEQYDSLAAKDHNNWCWIVSYRLPYAKFKNELIGVLCSELSEGKELNEACQAWNKRVDPANYMKATAPITKKQIEEAKTFVEENGYSESFDRRCATLTDIKVDEIKHINAGDGKVKSVSVFDSVKATSTRHKRSEFDGLEEVSIDKFMKDILPTCTSVEAYLSNRHEKNMVTMTTTNRPESKPIFKWNNNYSWTFNGNLAGKSEIKEAVKSEGGKIDGVLRFSIIWNQDGKDILDFDAHCKEPSGSEIYFSNKVSRISGGTLDVDMIRPSKLGVENITWQSLSKMKEGVYKFWIRNFDGGSNKGFKAEIEFDGQIFLYEYNTPVSGSKKDIIIAEVTLKDGQFSIKHITPESAVSSKDIYALESNQFHKVNLVCLSPNHWGKNEIGNKHYFFMLEGCKSPVSLRSFHNENLNAELLGHRKVMEVLGNTTHIESIDNQLSGLGFNATVRDEVIVKLGGTHKRMIKIKF